MSEIPKEQAAEAMPLGVLEWAQERLDNTTRIAATKTGEDRDGWLEDRSYWQMIVGALQRDSEQVARIEAMARLEAALAKAEGERDAAVTERDSWRLWRGFIETHGFRCLPGDDPQPVDMGRGGTSNGHE
jgi:hypothetical protein